MIFFQGPSNNFQGGQGGFGGNGGFGGEGGVGGVGGRGPTGPTGNNLIQTSSEIIAVIGRDLRWAPKMIFVRK